MENQGSSHVLPHMRPRPTSDLFCWTLFRLHAASHSRSRQWRQRRHPLPTRAQAPQSSEMGGAGSMRWYFAYGANLSGEVLRSRGLPPPERAVRAIAPPDAVLTFQHRGGFATIDFLQHEQLDSKRARNDKTLKIHGSEPWATTASDAAAGAAGHDGSACRIVQPHGMLYLLSDAQLAALAQRETGYKLTAMAVTPYEFEKSMMAAVFISQRLLRLPRPVPPTQRYLDVILTGARSCELVDSYIERLETVPTAKSGGLPAEYFDTPSGPIAAAIVSSIVLIVTSFWLLHQ